MYNYFVVFNHINVDNSFGFGNVIVRTNNRIESLKNPTEMNDWVIQLAHDIEKHLNLNNVIILNYKLIGDVDGKEI